MATRRVVIQHFFVQRTPQTSGKPHQLLCARRSRRARWQDWQDFLPNRAGKGQRKPQALARASRPAVPG